MLRYRIISVRRADKNNKASKITGVEVIEPGKNIKRHIHSLRKTIETIKKGEYCYYVSEKGIEAEVKIIQASGHDSIDTAINEREKINLGSLPNYPQ
jgi:hypothetical protein